MDADILKYYLKSTLLKQKSGFDFLGKSCNTLDCASVVFLNVKLILI